MAAMAMMYEAMMRDSFSSHAAKLCNIIYWGKMYGVSGNEYGSSVYEV